MPSTRAFRSARILIVDDEPENVVILHRVLERAGVHHLESTTDPLEAVAIVDVFDALTQKRPYKSAWPVDEALAKIDRQRGRQFDPVLVDAFLRSIERELRV